MSDLNVQASDQLYYNALDSIRSRLETINVGDSLTEKDVILKYRSIFNSEKVKYDTESKLKDDILTVNCGIDYINGFLTKSLNYCWLDFFGSDSFSDKQEKKQIFFATLCESERSSKLRRNHVFRYQEWLKQNIPVDIFIQLFFSTKNELDSIDVESIKKDVVKAGFYINCSSGCGGKGNYYDIITNKTDVSKHDLLLYLLNSLSHPEDDNLFELDYNNLIKGTGPEASFLQGVCNLNYTLHDSVNYILFLPIPCPDGSKGLICLGAKNKLSSENISKLSTLAFTILYPFVSSYKSIWHQIRLKNESIKSAKAAIMSRNMSHNIGSHVMSYLKQQLDSTAAILGEKSEVLSDLVPQTIRREILNTSTIELPFLVGLGKFIGYVQERQDYIATISTDFIPSGTPVNLKDSIYDELNPDLRYLRHKISPESDFGNNRPQNILLNYIAKSEGLSRENMDDGFNSKNDIRLGYIHYYSKNDYSVFGFEDHDSTAKALKEMRKINMCLPGGLIGRQAIFSIFENLIRNAAKHGNKSKIENLDFTIDVIDGMLVAKNKCPQWTNRINDPQWRRLYKHDPDVSDYYIITITDNLPYFKKNILKTLRDKALYEDYVVDGVMNTSYKGIKEIRISAAWLRGDMDENHYFKYTDELFSKKELKAPLVAIELCGSKKDGQHLRYAFCVKKNKMVAVVKDVDGVRMDGESLSHFERLQQQDYVTWSIVTKDELLKQKVCYSFILIPDDESAYNALRPLTSNRLCRWTPPKKNSLLNDSNSALIYVYKLFSNLTKSRDYIAIWDGLTYQSSKEHGLYDRIITSFYDKYDVKIKYVYRKHHATEADYKLFRKEIESNHKRWKYECVEGITGDNSSDRMIRREPLDEKWYYTHLYAMKKKVAVIDERLFKMVHNISEDKLSNLNTGKVVGNSHQTMCYHDKGVDVYTIIKNATTGKMNVVGCVKQDYNNSSFENSFACIATFDKNSKGNPVLIPVENYKKILKNYDYISIHQGILDKVYENLLIYDESRKIKVTSVIFDKMMKSPIKIGDFLPRFIIHSGRARPNKDDMPQKLPFIQYAALENAVKDTKAILVELLDYAKYEQY